MNIVAEYFEKTPRYTGPVQRIAQTPQEIRRQMQENSGVLPGFVSVYSFQGNSPIVDKAFFDCDYGSKEETLKVGQKIFQWAEDNGLNAIPLWSGYRGPHVHITFKPKIYKTPAKLLKLFSYKVIQESGIYDLIEEKKGNRTKTYKVPKVDTKVIGDIRRLCRYPNTQRTSDAGLPLQSFCILLDPERFLDMDVNEVIELSKSPQPYSNLKLPETSKTLNDFNYSDVNLADFRSSEIEYEGLGKSSMDRPEIANFSRGILQRLLVRPCVREAVMGNNPSHIVRYAATVDLRDAKVHPDHIITVYKGLKWHDYREDETTTQVYNICKNSEFKKIPKSTMKQLGICRDCGRCQR